MTDIYADNECEDCTATRSCHCQSSARTRGVQVMYIIELTSRFGNNFHFVAYCRYCGKTSHHGDGYADAYYQQEVLPHRHCPHCELDDWGDPTEELAASDARYPDMMDLREP